MKKIFCLLLIAFSLLNVSSIYIYADNDKYYEIATEFLANYYNADREIISGEYADNFLVPKLESYVEKKLEYKDMVNYIYDTDKENFQFEFELLSHEVNKNIVHLKIMTHVKFNYVTLPDVESAFGEVSDFFFNMNDFKIIDWYILDGDYDYDYAIRNEKIGFENHNVFSDKSRNGESINIDNIQEDFLEKLVENSKLEKDNNQVDISDTQENNIPNIRTYATLNSLNKTAIRNYAVNNAKPSPSSGGSGVSYYDFSKISGAYDCTNFVSHAILAGGAVPYDTGSSGISSTGWYYRDTSNRSSSWTGVPNLYNFIVNNKTKGPTGTGASYYTFNIVTTATSSRPYVPGDVIQYYSASYGNWRHSTIVTDYYNVDNYNNVGALVAGRSSSSSYYTAKKAADIYAGEAKRVIRLTGYYK